MSVLLSLLVALVVLGVVFGLAWFVVNQLPIPQPFKGAILAVIALICIVVLLGVVGWLPGFAPVHYR